MALYGAFSSSMLGMMSQSRSLHNISQNIANISTGGYKGTTTQFSTVLSRSLFNVSDSGGVRPNDISTITKQGSVVSSENNTDVAINGQGFFVMNTQQDGSGTSLYGRDGSLEVQSVNDITINGIGGTTITSKDGYLVDKNGHFIQGWAYSNGAVTTTGTPSSLRVDTYAFANEFQATTTANLGLNLPANAAVGDTHQYTISVYDSAGESQSVQLNFEKTGTLAWTVSTTSSRTPTAQVDTITLAGTVGEVGDQYTVDVGGNAVTYTTDGTEASLDVIRDNLVALIAATPNAAAIATAAAAGTGALTLTAVTAGGAMTNSSSATQGPASVAQTDTVTFAGGVTDGDVYNVTINGITLSKVAAGDTLTSIRDDLLGQINIHGVLGPLVTATTNGVDGINLTSDTAGVAYTLATSVTDNGGGPTIPTITTGTANYTALADNTATLLTTTPNVTNTVTGATTPITFKNDGTISTPTSYSLALTFNGGATSAAAIDLTKLTEFAGDFLPQSYSKDGFAASSMKSFNFDSSGNIVGSFADNTYRPIYQLALGVFNNPNALESVNGNVYKPTDDSGTVTITTAGAEGYATFSPNSLEKANVDIADEFSKMMMTQTAYNAASTVFRTTDEMTVTARDLKR